MKKIILFSIVSVLMLLVLTQCKHKNEEYESIKVSANQHKVEVKEVLNANSYTYLFVSEGDKEYWMAIPTTDVTVGKTYIYENGMEMKNFESKDLKRTFESIYFVEAIIDPSAPVVNNDSEMGSNPHGSKSEVDGVTSTELMKGLTLAKGAISLHDLYTDKQNYKGKTVVLTGKVISFSADILSKNWIHLQDGSSFKGSNDVTVTTLETLKEGDIVTLKGTVVLDKDLGMGYKYDVIIEDAVSVK